MRAKKIAVHVFFGIVAISLFFSFYFFLRKPHKIVPPKIEEKERKIVVMRGATYVSEKNGKVEVRLKAKIARKYLERNEIEMEDIEGYYDGGEKGQVSFRGGKGIVDTENKKAILFRIDAHLQRRYEFKTDSISFDLKTHVAFTQDPVFIKSQEFSITGRGMEGRLKEGKFMIRNGVSGTISLEDRSCAFKSDTFIYDNTNETYVLHGNVRADGENMYIKCERLYVYRDAEGIKKAEAFSVRELFSKGSVAKCDKAIYDFKEKKLILLGRVDLRKEDIQLIADWVEYDTERGTLLSSSPRLKMRSERF